MPELCNKRKYRNSGAAEGARKYLACMKRYWHEWEMNVYFCQQCQAWHLGHVSQKELTKRIEQWRQQKPEQQKPEQPEDQATIVEEPKPKKLNLVMRERPDGWIVICEKLGLAGFGETMTDAMAAFEHRHAEDAAVVKGD